MRELANRCDSKIDEASVIQYVINGIDGPRSDKIILYGATSFSEFRQKLLTYESVIKNMGIHNTNSPNFRHSYESRGRDFKQQSFQRKPTKFNVSDAAENPQRCFIPLTGYLPPEKLFRKRLTLILRFPSKMQQTFFLSPFRTWEVE
ncbi:hypothetical protein TNCV_5027711 [Trichonephila clavipes]|nr:hypothetical protein TNCV_5027711 [Trichonephila clavipes]